ncbi:MAG: hypothetical protein FJ297_01645 [Planctomycetes bacterium]|nr:hypothetical protein [Planctomycetota bacterium]
MQGELTADLTTLLGLFPRGEDLVARCERVRGNELPDTERALLDHGNHMTETVEVFWGEPVDVEVLDRRAEGARYARKILLRRRSNRAVVLFALVRLELGFLSEEVRGDIVSERIPLGRTLIEHGVLRHVRRVGIWKLKCGIELARHFSVVSGALVYGRTALIHCGGAAAVELLEIVPPMRRQEPIA